MIYSLNSRVKKSINRCLSPPRDSLKVLSDFQLFDTSLQQTICPSFPHYSSVSLRMHITSATHNPSQWGTSWDGQGCIRKKPWCGKGASSVCQNAYSQIPHPLLLGTMGLIFLRQFHYEAGNLSSWVCTAVTKHSG